MLQLIIIICTSFSKQKLIGYEECKYMRERSLTHLSFNLLELFPDISQEILEILFFSV